MSCNRLTYMVRLLENLDKIPKNIPTYSNVSYGWNRGRSRFTVEMIVDMARLCAEGRRAEAMAKYSISNKYMRKLIYGTVNPKVNKNGMPIVSLQPPSASPVAREHPIS
jgi:hypothetical protein